MRRAVARWSRAPTRSRWEPRPQTSRSPAERSGRSGEGLGPSPGPGEDAVMNVHTIGHGRRSVEELVGMLDGAGVQTLVDVRRYPGSRRNPQFGQGPLAAGLAAGGIAYRHEQELGGRLKDEPGEDRFPCLRVAAFRSYAARIAAPAWQEALARALAEPAPAFMCAETPWWRCHRRLIAELLT